MAYNTSLLKDKIDVIEPDVQGAKTLWYWGFKGLICGVTWQKGARRLMQGDTTLYDAIMVRMRYTEAINDRCRFVWKGHYYEIENLYDDFTENTVQITAHEISKFRVTERPDPEPEQTPTPDPEPEPEPHNQEQTNTQENEPTD